MKRKATFLVLGLGAVSLAGGALAWQNATWLRPIEPFQIMGNTWYVGTEGLAAYLVTTPEGHILIDVGLPQNAATVERNIEKLGFRLADVKILLNSHAHFDHSGGLAEVKADTGATLIASEGDRRALEEGIYPGSEGNPVLNFPPVQVDRVIADGETVELGGVIVTARITPGHSAGCTTWTWPITDRDGSQHTAVNFCSASVAANSLVPEQYPGIVADYRETFEKVKTFDGDIFLAPHGDFYGMLEKRERRNQGANPFVAPGAFHRFVAAQQRAFETELARQQEAAQ